MTSRRLQTFRYQLSVPPPCSMASRLMARISDRLMHRTNGKPLLSQLVLTQPLTGGKSSFSALATNSDQRIDSV
jgi:hypothetical protein